MLHLLLIGGGEIGSPRVDGTFRPLETLTIDQHFVDSIGKKNPRLLFIPTATEQLDITHTYEQGIRSLYGDKLGCLVDVLYLTPSLSCDEMKQALEDADAIYIGGGNTGYMMQRWRETGLGELLKETAKSGKPIIGNSAGAMCWFEKVLIRKEDKEFDQSFFVEGLGLVKNFCIPHWNKHKSFTDLPISNESPFVAMDECAAVEICDNKLTIITSKPEAKVVYCLVSDKIVKRDPVLADFLLEEPQKLL